MIGQRLSAYAFCAAVVLLSFCWARATAETDIAVSAGAPMTDQPNAEPSIAVNPANPNQIAVVTFSGDWSDGDAPVWKSDDGGGHWRRVAQIPEPPNETGHGPHDQKVAFDRNGNLYVAELGIDSMNNWSDYIYHPNPNGNSDAEMKFGAAYGFDQPLLEIDNGPASSCRIGTAYSPWHGYSYSTNRDESHVENSPDFGQHVYDHRTGSTNFSDLNTRVALASDGKAFIVYRESEGKAVPSDSNFEYSQIMVQRSDDCGAHWDYIGNWVRQQGNYGSWVWDPRVSVTGATPVVNYAAGKQFGAGSMTNIATSGNAWIAVDPYSGDVYVSYVNRDSSNKSQIYVARSSTQGVRWTTTPVTVGAYNCAFPEIAVAGPGTVGVLYVDYDTSGATTTYRHHLALSHDHGQTWEDEILQTMDPTTLPNAISKFIWGDYEGLVAVGSQFYGVFTGRSIGRATPQLDPIFFTVSAYLVIPNPVNFCSNCVFLYYGQDDPFPPDSFENGIFVFGGEILGVTEVKGVLRTVLVSPGSSIDIVGHVQLGQIQVVEAAQPVALRDAKVGARRASKRGMRLVGLALDRKGRLFGMAYSKRRIPLSTAARPPASSVRD